jgi:hypothetical protein
MHVLFYSELELFPGTEIEVEVPIILLAILCKINICKHKNLLMKRFIVFKIRQKSEKLKSYTNQN